MRPGTHVSSVGYAPPDGELPKDLFARGALYVEDDSAFETPPVGCGELQGLAPGSAIRLGDAMTGAAPGRVSREQITIYKAMGVAMEDLVAAEIAYRRALAEGVGAAATI